MTTIQPDISTFTRLSARASDSLQALRERAMRRFQEVGLPRDDDEEWRFTNTDPLAEVSWTLPEAAHDVGEIVAKHTMPGAVEIVLVNGKPQPMAAQLPRGLWVGPLSAAPANIAGKARAMLGGAAPVEFNPFVALNTGLIEDVIVIHTVHGATIEPVVHLLSISTSPDSPLLVSPRVLVIVGAGAMLRLVETHVSQGEQQILSNTVVEIFAGQKSVVEHYQVQWNDENTSAIQSTVAALQNSAAYTHHHASLSGKLIRNDLHAILDGEGADATLNGVVLIDGERHVDNHTLIRHEKPNCTSHELYKHVVADRSRGVFKGKIFVQKDAQHTDAKQTSRTLLLSDHAFMESMPALEIYADDVKCTHGSTVGPLDEQMLFYLRSRGLSAEAAQHLLIYAFAADITQRMKVREVRRRIESYLAAMQDLPQDLSIEAT